MSLGRDFLPGAILALTLVAGWLAAALALIPATAATQPQETEKVRGQSSSGFTLKVPVEVVVVNAIVTDRDGKPITDLTADDFEVFENRKKQTIQSFSQEIYQNPQSSLTWGSAVGAEEPVPEASPEKPRLLSLVIDDLTYPPTGMLRRTIQAVRGFVERGLRAQNHISIMTASRGYFVPFTQDRELLLAEIDRIYKKLDFTPSMNRPGCVSMTDAQAEDIHVVSPTPGSRAFDVAMAEAEECGVGSSENGLGGGSIGLGSPQQVVENYVRTVALQHLSLKKGRTRRLLDVLRGHIRSLGPVEAQKSLILLSGGFLHRALRYDLERLVDMALKTGTIFNTIRATGLETSPMNDVSKDVTVNSILRLEKALLVAEDRRQKGIALDYLARATGGTYFKDNNDLVAGLRKVVDQQFSYYILSYATPPKKPDGRYYRLRVRVSRPGVRVTHREGFYAPKERLSPEEQKKKEMLEAMRAPTNLREIPLQMFYHGSRLHGDTYRLELVTRLGFEDLPFLVEEGKRINRINLAVVAFDAQEKYVGGDEKAWNFKLSDSSYQTLLKSGLTSKVVLEVPAGRYQVKVAARENLNAGLGSLRRTVEVPLPSDQDTMGTLGKTVLRGLHASRQHRDLSLDFKANFFYQESDRALVLITARVSYGSEVNTPKIWLPGKDLRLMGVAYSDDGQAESVFSQTLPLVYGKADSAVQGFLKLKPGKYRIKLVAADRQGRLATTEQALWIPALPRDALMISGLVLSQDLEPFSPAAAGMQVPEARWLFHRGFRVKPAVSNEIVPPQPLALFYKLYNASKLEDGNLTARVQAVKDTGEAVDFPPIALDRNHLEERAPGQVAVGFKLSTQSLSPGKYRIEITTEESGSGRTAITETDFVVTQGSETATSGEAPSPVIAGQTQAEETSVSEAVVGLDLKKIRDSLEIPRSSGRTTPALAYRFRGDILACANDRGELGYNPDHPGECGDLRGNRVQSHRLRGMNLFGANLSGMDLRKADLRDAVLLRADLTQARLWEADLRGADLRGAKLTGAELIKARLDGARLQGADLSDASLTQASLKRADLLGADLRRAILKDADLNRATLQVADLSEAVLFGSDLRRADLRGARMTQAALVDGKAANRSILISFNGNIRIGKTRFAGARYDESSQLPFDSQQAVTREMQPADTPSAYRRPEFMMDAGSEEFTVSGSAPPTLALGQPHGVPTDAEWPDFLDAVRHRIDGTSQNLPNFVCRRRTERFERLFRGWQEKDRLQEELMFTNGEESYQPVEGQKASGSQDGTYSVGEFAAALRNVFAPESGASFRLEGAEEIAGRQTVRVAYRIPREASSLQLSYQGNALRVAYRGLCWIDVNSYQVVRLIKEIVDLPQDFPIKTSEMSIAYDRIRIGESRHWLPVRAQFNMSVGVLQSARVHTRNIIRFTDYRQFETDVKLLLE
ncbi:MAG: VWA domain-containing protein [Acidobacteriota bacterium]|nr:VWA domain-containing protein [Acidobacteriota bacterium]